MCHRAAQERARAVQLAHAGVKPVEFITMTDPLAIAVASFETIARRMPILWWAACTGSPAAQAEARRMVVEKQMALADAMVAVQVEWMKALWRPWTVERQRDLFGNVVQAAAAPVARRVKANARRLGRR